MNSSVPIEIWHLKYKQVRYIWRGEYVDTPTEQKYHQFITQNEEVVSQTTRNINTRLEVTCLAFKPYYSLRCSAVCSGRRFQMLRRNVLLLSSESKSKTSKK
jgi:hypothetical protein